MYAVGSCISLGIVRRRVMYTAGYTAGYLHRRVDVVYTVGQCIPQGSVLNAVCQWEICCSSFVLVVFLFFSPLNLC